MLESTQWVDNNKGKHTKTKPGFFYRDHALMGVYSASVDKQIDLVCRRCYILAIISMKSH